MRGGTVKARPYRCSAAIWTGSRIASSADVPERRALLHRGGSRCLTGPPAEPQLLFCFINQSLLMLALWSCGRRVSVVQAQRQIHRVLLAACTSLYRIRGWSPSIDCGFDARRTSHPVAVPRTAGTTIPHSRGHRAREGGSTLYCGISQPLFATVRPPGSNAADQASWNSR
jgi:hypothetical protein